MQKKIIIILISFIVLTTVSFSIAQVKTDKFPVLKGPYLGQKPPGMTPEIFAPGILPSSNYHTTPVFTPDGIEAYWKMQRTNTISMIKCENGVWTAPKEITLSSKLDDFRDPCISPDGKKMFFLSKGKFDYQLKEKENIWFAERNEDGWSEPQPLNSNINSHELHWQVSVASNGNLYFTSRNSGFEDIYCSKYHKGEYQKPESLGAVINTEELCETTPFISPDEDYIIFSRWDLKDEKGLMQLYISFRNKNGGWGLAKKIENINYCLSPQVSHNGKYFFYMGLLNGELDIFWVSAKFIDELRPKE